MSSAGRTIGSFQWIVNNAGHALYGFVVATPNALFCEHLWVSVATGFTALFVREVEQRLHSSSWHLVDRSIDVAFGALGGLAAGLIWGFVAW